MIEYRTEPPAECVGCGAAMRRQRWATNGGRCSACLTGPGALQAAERAARLGAVRTRVPPQTEARINRLAAKRARRAAQA